MYQCSNTTCGSIESEETMKDIEEEVDFFTQNAAIDLVMYPDGSYGST